MKCRRLEAEAGRYWGVVIAGSSRGSWDSHRCALVPYFSPIIVSNLMMAKIVLAETCSWHVMYNWQYSCVMTVMSMYNCLFISSWCLMMDRTVNLNVQGEHEVFPWLQIFITRKLLYVEYKHIFLTLFKLVSKILCHVSIVTFGFWTQHFQTGGLGEMVRHPDHHDLRISPPWLLFMGVC